MPVDTKAREMAINLIGIVINDCLIQVNCLKTRGDVNWDCYNTENWKTDAQILKDAIKLIKEI